MTEQQLTEEKFAYLRSRMVDDQIVRRGINDPDVIDAMRTVPRHLFIPDKYRSEAYKDGPVPIGAGQTISQPFIVASMTEELEIDSTSKVLEIGTGCGYQTAVLAEIADHIYSIELVPELYRMASETLRHLHYDQVQIRLGDGSRGWIEEAPFDAIIVTAAAPQVPRHLIDQLGVGGRMILPVETGLGRQELVRVVRTPETVKQSVLYEVRFVPMQGEIDEH